MVTIRVERANPAEHVGRASSRCRRNSGRARLRMTPERARPSMVSEITRNA
jgi:hypothetical protein